MIETPPKRQTYLADRYILEMLVFADLKSGERPSKFAS